MKKIITLGIIMFSAFVFTSCVPNDYIHVDKNNTSGPWDGTKTHPFAKIQQGLNKAVALKYDGVIVHSGVYNENVILEDNMSLIGDKNTAPSFINGNISSPTITLKGRNYVSDLSIGGGSVGIYVDVDKMLSVSDKPMTIINDNIIESKYAIHVKTSKNLTFGAKDRKNPWVSISGNWIKMSYSSGSTGIRVDLTGPKTGVIALKIDINDNIICEKSSGIIFFAEGQGPNPGGFVRADITGEIANNLLYDNTLDGISMESKNLGDASTLIFGNTIVYNGGHAIVSDTSTGSDGDAMTHPNVTNNILAFNKGYGYLELDLKTSASDLDNNIFYQNNSGHYSDYDTQKDINSQAGLNTPMVQSKVVFNSGSGNLVTNPQFQKGGLYLNGIDYGKDKAGEFFLTQAGVNKSPGVDNGFGSAKNGGISKKTTSVTYSFDTGNADIGFHYTKQ